MSDQHNAQDLTRRALIGGVAVGTAAAGLAPLAAQAAQPRGEVHDMTGAAPPYAAPIGYGRMESPAPEVGPADLQFLA